VKAATFRSVDLQERAASGRVDEVLGAGDWLVTYRLDQAVREFARRALGADRRLTKTARCAFFLQALGTTHRRGSQISKKFPDGFPGNFISSLAPPGKTPFWDPSSLLSCSSFARGR